ncbi:methyltransferase domain-containing protein [Thalassobaculum sp.]|uniref:class I SAM-dependent methyltransferase n=1 Tax=Thalassobaculum sp. TaxID=2022740 RepID=UPI0032EDB0DE
MAPRTATDIGSALEALQRAGVLFRSGLHLEAAAIYRDVIRQRPRIPDVHNNLGIALKAAGHVADAVPCFRRAVRLKPDYVAAHANLAAALEALDRPLDGLEHRIDAWRLNPDDLEQRDALVTALRRCPFDKPHAGARSVLTVLFERDGLDRQALASPAIRVWRAQPAIRRAVEAAAWGYPEREHPGSAFRPLTGFLPDELALSALASAVIVDPDMEAAIVFTRRHLVSELSALRPLGADLSWLAALALQARAVEWVWPETPEEAADLQVLDRLIDESSPMSERVLVRAMYRPMESDPMVDALRREASMLRYDDASLWALLLRRTFLDTHAESRLEAEMPALTAIADDTSAAVRAQYEENPYPRWLSIDRRPPRSLADHLRRVLPSAPQGRVPDGPMRILIAGCGTGRHAIQTALRYHESRVLAVDLSRRSLAYAKRMARDLGIDNLTFSQADILALEGHADRFDLIESSGVLHHLSDPMAGWRVLRGLLAPGGLMRIALYSRRARAGFDDIRATIPVDGPVIERVRQARRTVMGMPAGHPARALLRTADFYAASGVRDALLHVSETVVDPIWIDEALRKLDLRFLGFELPDPAILALYRRHRRDDPAALDLSVWDSVEAERPDIFLGMYQFWCREA